MATTTQLTVDANTIGLWHMDGTAASAAKIDNAEGTAALDLTENLLPLSATGVIVPTTDGAYSTTLGTNVSVADNAALDVSNITIEGWFKTASNTCGFCHRYTDGTNRSFRFIITATGKLEIIMYDSGNNNSTPIDSTTTINDGAWHYFAVTFDGTTIKLYVDPASSTPQATTTSISSLAASSAPFIIGKGNPVETGNPTVTFDEFRYSNTARTGTAIYNYYNDIATTSVKTVNGLAVTSVKTINGLAIASVKTVNGLA